VTKRFFCGEDTAKNRSQSDSVTPGNLLHRITKELRERGWKVNPKRVYRLMREDNLLCVRKRKFACAAGSARCGP
jgi:transposase InsO family protein